MFGRAHRVRIPKASAVTCPLCGVRVAYLTNGACFYCATGSTAAVQGESWAASEIHYT